MGKNTKQPTPPELVTPKLVDDNYLFEDRAAIMEHDSGLSKDEAEVMAKRECGS